MIPIRCSARTCLQGEEYLPIEQTSLATQMTVLHGSGAANDPVVIQAVVQNTDTVAWQGVIKLDYTFASAEPRFFLPGFLYGTNRGDAPLATDSKAPRLRKSPTVFPASPWWLVRSDRLSHPVAFAFTGDQVVGLSASPYYVICEDQKKPWNLGINGVFFQYAGFGCDIDKQTISYTLGYENAPWFFLNSHTYYPGKPLKKNVFSLESGEQLVFQIAVFHYAASDERGIHEALQWIYNAYHQVPRRGLAPLRVIGNIAQAVFTDAWMPEKQAYAGFVYDRSEGYVQSALPSISWTNGLSVAVPMLEAALRLNRPDIRSQAIACIQHIVDNSINPQNGLPYTVEKEGIWCNNGWWYDHQPTPGHSSYLVGQAVYLLLKAFEYERKLGKTVHQDWMKFAANVLKVTEKTRNGDGEYPYLMSEKTGAGLCYDSFSGAWCLAAAAYYSFLTDDKQYIDHLLHSEQHYHKAYITHLECYGGPLDIDKQIDSEGILAYIRAVRWLHEITGDSLLLDHMRDALHYEFTFKFCYNSPIQVPPLSKVGWSSCGGSITSVSNPHIHPMSSSIVDEMIYFVQKTGDEYVQSRLSDTILWSCQVSNTYDKEYDYGKTGWMSERFCHSEGLLTEKYPDGSPASTWFALMPWACGCILEGLCGKYIDGFPLKDEMNLYHFSENMLRNQTSMEED